jgi:hypothetical protein
MPYCYPGRGQFPTGVMPSYLYPNDDGYAFVFGVQHTSRSRGLETLGEEGGGDGNRLRRTPGRIILTIDVLAHWRGRLEHASKVEQRMRLDGHRFGWVCLTIKLVTNCRRLPPRSTTFPDRVVPCKSLLSLAYSPPDRWPWL